MAKFRKLKLFFQFFGRVILINTINAGQLVLAGLMLIGYKQTIRGLPDPEQRKNHFCFCEKPMPENLILVLNMTKNINNRSQNFRMRYS